MAAKLTCFDLQLIAEFLERPEIQEQFAIFLEENSIDGFETGPIIESIKAEGIARQKTSTP